MTTTSAVAVNANALRNLADKLTGLGYTGDDVHEVAEHIALNLLADGYRKLQPTPPLRPTNVASDAERRHALDIIRDTLANRTPSCGAEHHPDPAATVYCRQPAGHGGQHHSVDGQDVWS